VLSDITGTSGQAILDAIRQSPLFGPGDFQVPSFPRPCRGELQLVKQFVFCMLHALGAFGVAAGSRDPL